MPSCVIEYASSLNAHLSAETLVKTVHRAAGDSGLFQSADIKTRAIGVDSYQVGEDHSTFVHVTVHLMPGRTEQQRQALCEKIGQSLHALSLPSPVSLTVESVEIHKKSYFKLVTD